MNIAVVGAGTVGAGLAQYAALAGHAVALYDISPKALQQAQLEIGQAFDAALKAGRVSFQQVVEALSLLGSTTILEHCAEADLIVDCAPDEFEIKKLIFERLDNAAPPSTLLATNTISIPISTFESFAPNYPQRVIGTRFHPPLATNRLVELVRTLRTPQATLDQAQTRLRELGKEVIVVQDVPGFLVDQLLDVYTGEALRLLEEEGLDAATLDRLAASMGFQVPPLKMLEQIGLEKSLRYKQQLYERSFHEARHRPHPYHQQMVAAGRRSFYENPPADG